MTNTAELQARLEEINKKIAELRAETNARTAALQKLQQTKVNSRTMFRREMLETIIRG